MGSTWGDHFSSISKHLVGKNLNPIMKFISIICFFGFSQAFVVRREAEPDADADAFGIGYGASPRAVSAPVCKSVPQKVCKDRTIETPRKVCHTEHDEIVDTTVTEHCQTTTTTKCEQTSSQTRHSSNIVGSDSKVVSTGVIASPEVTVARGASTHGGVVSGYTAGTSGAAAGYGAGGGITSTGVIGTTGLIGSSLGYGGVPYGKREADADAEADAGFYGYGSNGVSPVSTSAPICRSVPVRTCNKVPVNRPRKVAKTVCKTVTDIKVIKDCTDTVSTTCTQQSVQQSHSSAVVGSDSKVGPSAVVANHGTVSLGNAGVAGGYGTGAVVGGYSSGSLLGAVSGGYTGGVVSTGYAAPVVSGVATSGAATAGAVAAATGCVNSTGQSVPCSE